MNPDSVSTKIFIGVASSLVTLLIVTVLSFAAKGALIKALGGITQEQLRTGVTVYIHQPGTDDIMSYDPPPKNPNDAIFLRHKGEKGATIQQWVLSTDTP